jgi:thiamine biosynthesis lipoprotein
MGCEIVVAGAGRRKADAIAQLFADRERVFSRFRSDSELTTVNAAAGRPTVVSPAFAEMLERSLALAAETDGLVDPTVAARSRPWATRVTSPRLATIRRRPAASCPPRAGGASRSRAACCGCRRGARST